MNRKKNMEIAPTDSVGQRLSKLRRVRGFSAQALADRCAQLGAPELTRQLISNVETDRRGHVAVSEVMTFARALDIPPAALVPDLDRATNDDEEDRALRVGRALLALMRELDAR